MLPSSSLYDNVFLPSRHDRNATGPGVVSSFSSNIIVLYINGDYRPAAANFASLVRLLKRAQENGTANEARIY